MPPKYLPSPGVFVAPRRLKRDVVIVGGGHNGLVAGAYLAKNGLDVLVLERRHCIGGAAVTEEIIPGFKFSRASYLAGLMRPKIIEELDLAKHGFKYLTRDPSSFTPTKLDSEFGGKSLLLGSDDRLNYESIAQFSTRDADRYVQYEHFLSKIRDILDPLLDSHPPSIYNTNGTFFESIHGYNTLRQMLTNAVKHYASLPDIYEFMTAPAEQILNRWFEGDVLKTTLATDAVVGALVSPKQNGSAYVLLHHVMGEAAGRKGVWAYVEGGMGRVSEAIAKAAVSFGAEIITNAEVVGIQRRNGRASGVVMQDGTVIETETVLSGCTPYHTFAELLPGKWNQSQLQGVQDPNSALDDYIHRIKHAGNMLEYIKEHVHFANRAI